MGVSELRDKINKKFGVNIMFNPSDNLGIVSVPRFSSGSLMLDFDLGGGWPERKIIEIYGPESSCKSAILYKAIATVTNRDKNNKAVLLDEEGSYDNEWAKQLGIKIENLEIVRGQNAEQTLDILELLTQSGEYAIIGLDSTAALIPKDELDKSTDEWQMGLTARLMGKAMRKAYRSLNEATRSGGTTTLFILNQIRFKIGVMFGSPETTPGGNAVKYASAIRLDLRKEEMLKNANEIVYGQVSRYTTVKNKTAPPLRKGMFTILLDGARKGEIANISALVDLGIHTGKIVQGGSWYSGDWLETKAQGKDKVILHMKELPKAKLNEYIEDMEKELLAGSPVSFRFKDE